LKVYTVSSQAVKRDHQAATVRALA